MLSNENEQPFWSRVVVRRLFVSGVNKIWRGVLKQSHDEKTNKQELKPLLFFRRVTPTDGWTTPHIIRDETDDRLSP